MPRKRQMRNAKLPPRVSHHMIIVSIHAYILIHNLFLETFLEAIAKREAQLQDKKEADEKRKIAAEGKYCWIGYKNMLRFISMLSSHYLIYQCLV